MQLRGYVLITLDCVVRKGSKELEKQNQAMRSMFAMLRARARASITTGREGTRFVTSTSEADKEQQVEAQSRYAERPSER